MIFGSLLVSRDQLKMYITKLIHLYNMHSPDSPVIISSNIKKVWHCHEIFSLFYTILTIFIFNRIYFNEIRTVTVIIYPPEV